MVGERSVQALNCYYELNSLALCALPLGDVSFALLTVHVFCDLFLVLQNVVLLWGLTLVIALHLERIGMLCIDVSGEKF